MPQIIIAEGIDGQRKQKEAIEEMRERRGRVPIPTPRSRLAVPKGNLPEGKVDAWPTLDRLEDALELGAEPVQDTEENRKRYGFPPSLDGTHKHFLMRGDHVLVLIPSENMQYRDEATVLEAIDMRGSRQEDYETFEGATADIQSEAKRLGIAHPTRTSQTLSDVERKAQERRSDLKSMVVDAGEEEKANKRPRARRGDNKPKTERRPGKSRSLNQVLAEQGQSRSAVIPDAA